MSWQPKKIQQLFNEKKPLNNMVNYLYAKVIFKIHLITVIGQAANVY